MIAITKPDEAPRILENKGKTATQALRESYSKDKAAFESGTKKFEFDSGIYGHEEVKKALVQAQQGKCFLCESRILHVSYGDVEHFRPKGGSRQTKREKLKTPGYYWLAYEWTNLFLSCQICNQRFKKNLFPLEDPKRRAISHESDLTQEKPLFINPAVEDPEDFISFRGITPFAVNGNRKGNLTIENAGLRREELDENRLELYQILKELYRLAIGIPKTPFQKEAKELLKKRLDECQSNKHQYSSMFRAAVRDQFKY